jgi:tetratricopeptide (TPR) repeat protein
MTIMHEEWTEKLSDYLDGELPSDERRAVEAHLSGCIHCAGVLDELKRVVARARWIEPRPPQSDLWAGIAREIDATSGDAVATTPFRSPVAPVAVRMVSRRVSLSLMQLAAAAVLLMAVSGGLVWSIAGRPDGLPYDRPDANGPGDSGSADLEVRRDDYDIQAASVSFADQQYDAAVADLEKALNKGRRRLDASTIAIVEHNLQIIDQAIAQARQALAADPANGYLSSHLVEARRRKLDLLRRAAALTSESD